MRGRVTHFIPPFTRRNGRKQEAVCGEWIEAKEHASPPTCAQCLQWVNEEPKTLEELEAKQEELFGATADDLRK